jgi:hypothetical protein
MHALIHTLAREGTYGSMARSCRTPGSRVATLATASISRLAMSMRLAAATEPVVLRAGGERMDVRSVTATKRGVSRAGGEHTGTGMQESSQHHI